MPVSVSGCVLLTVLFPSPTFISHNSAKADSTGLVDSGKTDNNTIAKGSFEQFAHLTTVLLSVWLEPDLEETNVCSWYANMTISQLSYSINSGQPRACRALLRGSGLHTRTSPRVGMLLKVTPWGWEDPYHVTYLVSELGISVLKLWNLS